MKQRLQRGIHCNWVFFVIREPWMKLSLFLAFWPRQRWHSQSEGVSGDRQVPRAAPHLWPGEWLHVTRDTWHVTCPGHGAGGHRLRGHQRLLRLLQRVPQAGLQREEGRPWRGRAAQHVQVGQSLYSEVSGSVLQFSEASTLMAMGLFLRRTSESWWQERQELQMMTSRRW